MGFGEFFVIRFANYESIFTLALAADSQ